MKRVRFTTVAEGEIERAASWYEQQRDGMGLRFTDKVFEAIDRIAINPLAYRKVIGEARRVSVSKFPSQIWFKINLDGSLVIACLHARRSLRLVKERASGVIPIQRRRLTLHRR